MFSIEKGFRKIKIDSSKKQWIYLSLLLLLPKNIHQLMDYVIR